MFCQYGIHSYFKRTKFFTIKVSNKSVLKSGRLKYSDISIKGERKLLLPFQYKSNGFKKDCSTKDDLIYTMYLRIF